MNKIKAEFKQIIIFTAFLKMGVIENFFFLPENISI